MRILNSASDQPLLDIVIYLTPAEAIQMQGYLEQLLAEPDQHHAHLNDEDFTREVTLAVYTDQNLPEFDARSRKLIEEGQ